MERIKAVMKEMDILAKNAHGRPAKVWVRKTSLLEWIKILEETYGHRKQRTNIEEGN
jgi:hypothetical protein